MHAGSIRKASDHSGMHWAITSEASPNPVLNPTTLLMCYARKKQERNANVPTVFSHISDFKKQRSNMMNYFNLFFSTSAHFAKASRAKNKPAILPVCFIMLGRQTLRLRSGLKLFFEHCQSPEGSPHKWQDEEEVVKSGYRQGSRSQYLRSHTDLGSVVVFPVER